LVSCYAHVFVLLRFVCVLVCAVEGDYRVVRTCATGGRPEDGCVARTGTSRIKLWYCECLGDECNSARQATFTSWLLAVSATSVGIFTLPYV